MLIKYQNDKQFYKYWELRERWLERLNTLGALDTDTRIAEKRMNYTYGKLTKIKWNIGFMTIRPPEIPITKHLEFINDVENLILNNKYIQYAVWNFEYKCDESMYNQLNTWFNTVGIGPNEPGISNPSLNLTTLTESLKFGPIPTVLNQGFN